MSNETDNKYTFIWKIENYSLCSRKNGEFLVSPPFTTENVGDSIWHMLLYPRGINKCTEEYMSIYLYRMRGDIRPDVNIVDVEIKMVGFNGNTLRIVKGENLLLSRGRNWGANNFLKRNQFETAMEEWKEDVITILCSIVNKKNMNSTAGTKIDSDHCIFKWDVEVPNIMDKPLQKMCDMPLFKINLNTSDDNIKFSICKQDENRTIPKHVACRVSLLNIHGDEVDSKRAAYIFSEEKDVWEFPNFITIEFLKENKSTVLKNEILKLLFEFTISKENEPINIVHPSGNTFNKQYSILKLTENFKKMYIDRLHSDIEFRVDGKQFIAHKSILAARSPVFSAMFDQDMLENLTGIVDITDVESDIFEIFLQYLYTATNENMDWKSACKLLILADKYDVEVLKVDCSFFLRSNLDRDNACEALYLADLFSYKQLKEFVFDYIINNSKEILTSPEWIEWAEKNAKLAAEVTVRIVTHFEYLSKSS